MRSYGIQYQLPPKSALEGSIRPPICVDFGAAVQLPRSFLWRWAFCDPWPSRCQHLRRCLATPLPQKRTTTAGRKRGWIRTSIRRRGRASTISGGKPDVYSGWPENMVVFLQKCRNEFKGVNDVETQSSILLDIVVTMPIHAIFFYGIWFTYFERLQSSFRAIYVMISIDFLRIVKQQNKHKPYLGSYQPWQNMMKIW